MIFVVKSQGPVGGGGVDLVPWERPEAASVNSNNNN